MLEEMRIRGLGVIDDAVLELGPGLTVVTGETGAGKTMVVQGLSLLFGGRADAGRIRPGADRAVVEGRLVLAADAPAVARAVEAGAELDDDGGGRPVLLVSRTIGTDGRSRAHVGGRSVPVGVLGDLGQSVLALHGQADQQRLLQPGAQRAVLDRFAGADALSLRDRVGERWGTWRATVAALQQLRAQTADRQREAELLRLGLAEVEAVAPVAGEDVAVAAQIERLAHVDELRTAADAARQALTGDDAAVDVVDALQLVTTARRALDPVARHDATLAELASRLAEVGHLLSDVAADLASYATGVDADPLGLATAQDRLAGLTALARRHGVDDVEQVLAWAQQASDRLLDLDRDDDRLTTLDQQAEQLREELAELAGRLSLARAAAATRFAAAVAGELSDLAMPQARVVAQVSQRESPDGLLVAGRVLAAGPEGTDDVELQLVPHPGAPPRPLHKGASGGELSRLMLAVEVVLAGADPVPVMVFDEVDAGVGGRAAVEVGRRLARLARDRQVVVVTHLPQVAAFADRHLLVVKDRPGDDAVTRSGVLALDDAERVVELSRMLAGHDSGLARGHAEELLAAAARDRAGTAVPR